MPVSYPILQPAIALVLWSLLVLLWLSAVRVPALRRANLDLRNVGGRGPDLDGVLPDRVQWKSHNYNHLMEQPTLFYAVVLALALAAPADTWSVRLAWAYVALRVVHSVYQAMINVVLVRSTIFTAYSVVLIALALRGAFLIF